MNSLARLFVKVNPTRGGLFNALSSRSISSVRGRDFLTLKQFSREEIQDFLWVAHDFKTIFRNRSEPFRLLENKAIATIFEKRSTRTRVSTETGAAQLGMHVCFLSPSDIHLGVNETVEDTARVLARYCDILLGRVYKHTDLEILSQYSPVPIINGLSDLYHPLQILADMQALQEHYGYLENLTVAWVGDGHNNVTHSYMMGCPLLGMNLRICCPKGYEPNAQITEDAKKLCQQHKTNMFITQDPFEAVKGADVIVTDTVVSMGREDDKLQRIKDFAKYQVDRHIVNKANSNWAFLHCLPRKKEEVTDDVFYDKQHSLVWEAAENRKWTVMAVMVRLLMDYSPQCGRPYYGPNADHI